MELVTRLAGSLVRESEQFQKKKWGVEKIGGEGKESFNMAPEIEFSQKFNFPPSHKTASYTG